MAKRIELETLDVKFDKNLFNNDSIYRGTAQVQVTAKIKGFRDKLHGFTMINKDKLAEAPSEIEFVLKAALWCVESMEKEFKKEADTKKHVQDTVPFNEEDVKAYLDKAIKGWREIRDAANNEADRNTAVHYVDAFQSARYSLFGKLLPKYRGPTI